MRSLQDYLNVRGAFMSHAFEIYDINDGLATRIFRFRITGGITSLAVCPWCFRLLA